MKCWNVEQTRHICRTIKGFSFCGPLQMKVHPLSRRVKSRWIWRNPNVQSRREARNLRVWVVGIWKARGRWWKDGGARNLTPSSAPNPANTLRRSKDDLKCARNGTPNFQKGDQFGTQILRGKTREGFNLDKPFQLSKDCLHCSKLYKGVTFSKRRPKRAKWDLISTNIQLAG